jgi:hypothetical protein
MGRLENTSAILSGTVSGFQQRTEQTQTAGGPRMVVVWDFRLERKDQNGQALPRVAVEMRGTEFIGSVQNGDAVEIDAPFHAGEVVQPRRVRNLTSGAVVTAREIALRRSGLALKTATKVVVFCLFIFWIMFILRIGPWGK